MLFKPVTLLLGAGVKTGQYMVQVVDGTVSVKRKLKQERAEFENEKAWFESEKQKQAEEWEEIKKAWEELLREREAFERQKAGEGKQEQHKEQRKGYDRSKAKSEQSKQQDRYFSEFASFNLNDFVKNDPYKVLGVDRNTEKKEVLRVYKRLMMRFHPDKFASEPLEKVKEANKIASLLNWAKGQVV